MADQFVLVRNFQTKITAYQTVLGLTAAEISTLQTLCDAIAESYTFVEHCKMTMQAATQWRDLIQTGEPMGAPVPASPVFPEGMVPTWTRGSVNQFFAFRDRIVAAPGYTMAIGEDLGIVGAENPNRPASDVAPVLKAVVSMGNTVNLTGSMQGMDALRVEYSRTGGTFTTVAFLTKTPGGFQITPANPAQPETGFIRAVFIKKNEEYGNFSPNYPVTVS